VLEHNAKEAVEKICQLFSALKNLETTPSAQGSLTTTLKQVEKQQNTLQEETNLTDCVLLSSQSSDQLTLGEIHYLYCIHTPLCFSEQIFKMYDPLCHCSLYRENHCELGGGDHRH